MEDLRAITTALAAAIKDDEIASSREFESFSAAKRILRRWTLGILLAGWMGVGCVATPVSAIVGSRALPTASVTSELAQADGVRIVESTDARTKQPDAYFANEYSRINARRTHFGFHPADPNGRPATIIGLALSGGGIRSNAFQMGVLSGLYAEKFGAARLLDRIDYVSSVSGGSWANIALWAWPHDLSDMFNCLDRAAEHGKSPAVGDCANVVGMLRTQQKPQYLAGPNYQRKEQWQRDIVQAHLPRGCDFSFANMLPQECVSNLVTKPYPIINSTHSARSESLGADGFPFETTPDGAGTVVDEGSQRPGMSSPGHGKAGFLVDFRRPEVQWMRREFFAARLPGGKSGIVDGTTLSLTAAHSSAVIKGPVVPAMFLTFYYQLRKGEARFAHPRLRKKYKLTDGGKSENTGSVALIDRGVDVLVMSHMSKEKAAFDDLAIAKEHVKNLFGCEIADVPSTHDHPLAQEASYRCSAAPTSVSKPTLHLHPWHGNIADFLSDLKARVVLGSKGAKDVLWFLENEQSDESDRFPQTPTFKEQYDERLIRAYYLLGTFAAKTEVAPFLRKHLKAE